jgi:2-polyprenyl-3-methyl-5-hydroxy-6-metoxy-1,4-benzoquinol methylase
VHYKLDGLVIRSENAAKPANQASHYLIGVLKECDSASKRTLDYGCGKLRYSTHLESLSRSLTVVDSEIQLSRTQAVHDKVTTIRDYVAEKWPSVRVLSTVQFGQDSRQYDFILCANVLSAIPHLRTRKAVVSLLRSRLSRRGESIRTSVLRWRTQK